MKKKHPEILPTSFGPKITKFCQLHLGQKSQNFANYMKIAKNHEILSTSWKEAKIMKFCQIHQLAKNHEILLTW